MITVGGFNTAIDKLVEIEALRPGAVHRARAVHAYPGGKGVHVAQTIAALGEPVQLVGLVDAASRTWFEHVLRERGVIFHGILTSGQIRTCLALRDADGCLTELLEPGPEVDAKTRAELVSTFRRLSLESDIAVLSGSLPSGCGDDTYAELVRDVQNAGVRCLVDASGAALRRAFEAQPFLIKPNRDEAAALVGRPIDGVADAARAVRALAGQGVAAPVLSLGVNGAVSIDHLGVLHASVSSGRAVSAVGSGDCMIGGLATRLARGDSLESALRLGVACGAANGASMEMGFVRRADVDTLLPDVGVTRSENW